MKSEKVFEKVVRKPLDYVLLFSMLLFDIGFFAFRLLQGASLFVLIAVPIFILLQIFLIFMLFPGKLEFEYRDAMRPYLIVFALSPVSYLIFGLIYHAPFAGVFYTAAILRTVLYLVFLTLSQFDKITKSVVALLVCFVLTFSAALSVNAIFALFDPELNFQLKWPLKRTLEYSYDPESDTYIVSGIYSGIGGNVEIPASYNGKRISRVAANAFQNDDFITDITVRAEESIATSFSSATANTFKNVSLGVAAVHSNVQLTIGDNAFADCDRLKTVTINAVSSLGANVFSGTPNLSKIEFTAFETGGISPEAFLGISSTVQILTNSASVDQFRQALAESGVRNQIVPNVNPNQVFVNFEDENFYIKTVIMQRGEKLTGEMLKIADGRDLYTDTVAGAEKNYTHHGLVADCTLEGWYSSDSFLPNQKVNFDGDFSVTESLTLYPRRLQIHKAELKGGYSGAISQTVLFTQDDQKTLAPISRTGYSFLLWRDTETNLPVPEIELGTTQDFVFEAEWQLEKPTVSVSSNMAENTMEYSPSQSMTLFASAAHTLSEEVEFAYQWYFGTEVLTGKTANTLSIGNVSESGNYKCIVTATQKTYGDTAFGDSAIQAVIMPQTLTIVWSVEDGKEFSYDKTSHKPTATATGTDDETEFTLSVGYFFNGMAQDEPVFAGEYTAVASLDSQWENYRLDSAGRSLSFKIDPALVTVTLKDQTAVYNGQTPVVKQGADCYIVSGTIFDGDDLGLVLTKEVGVTVDNYNLTANATNENYKITVNTAIFSVTKASVTISAEAQTSVYNGQIPTVSQGTDCYTVGGTIFDGDDLKIKVVSSTIAKDVGNYTLTIEFEENNNYAVSTEDGTFTITKASVTISADTQTAVYNGFEPASVNTSTAYTVTSGEFFGSDQSSVVVLITKGLGKDADSYALTLTVVTGNSNYDITTEDGTFTITKASVTIKPNEQTSVYNGQTQEVNATTGYSVIAGEFFGSDQNDIEVSITSGSHINAGKYALTLEVTVGSSNYNIISEQGDFVIGRAKLTITLKNQTSVYNGQIPTVSQETDCYTVGGTIFAGDNLGFTVVAEDLAANVVDGGYNLIGTATNHNYDVTVVSAKLVVTAAAITVKVADVSMTYRNSEPLSDFAYKFTVESGELFKPDGTNPDDLMLEFQKALGVNVGSYQLRIVSAGNPNYNVTISDAVAVFSVTRLSITVRLHDQTFTYSGATPALDQLAFTVVDNAYCEKSELLVEIGIFGINVNSYKILAAYSSPNHTITFDPNFGYVQIERLETTLTVTSFTITDGEPDPVFTYQVSTGTIFARDNIVVTLMRGEEIESGQFEITAALSGTTNNYTFTVVHGILTVLPVGSEAKMLLGALAILPDKKEAY